MKQLDYRPGVGTVFGGMAGAASPLLKYYLQARQKQILAGQNVALSVEDFNHTLQQIEVESRSLGYNPFAGKTVQEIEAMFLAKGFHVSEKYPGAALKGEGGYIHPQTGRSYHIDPRDFERYREEPHVDVNYLRKYKGTLPKEKRRYFGVLEDNL